MKKWILQLALALVFAIAGLCFVPHATTASYLQPIPVTVPTVPPEPGPVTPPVDADFTDADFAQEDQPELGSLSGGEVVVFVGGGVLLLVLLILIIIFLID